MNEEIELVRFDNRYLDILANWFKKPKDLIYLKSLCGQYYILLVKNKPVSCFSVVKHNRYAEGWLHIQSVFTAPSERHKGYAKIMFSLFFEETDKITIIRGYSLGVSIYNAFARRLYSSLGFKLIKYASDVEDVIIMEREK